MIFLIKFFSDNSIECETLDIPPEVIKCLEMMDKNSTKYLNDGTDCCSAKRQLDIIANINVTHNCKNEEIQVTDTAVCDVLALCEWQKYLQIQLSNNVYGNCELSQKHYNRFICVQKDECDC
jgi:hypothetical protein